MTTKYLESLSCRQRFEYCLICLTKVADPSRRVNTEAYDQFDKIICSRARSKINFVDTHSKSTALQPKLLPLSRDKHELAFQIKSNSTKKINLHAGRRSNKPRSNGSHEKLVQGRRVNDRDKKWKEIFEQVFYEKREQLLDLNNLSSKAINLGIPNCREANRLKQAKHQYQLLQVIGKGTFGVVYLARDVHTGRKVAIKKVLQDKRYKNRQLHILKLLKHPNVLGMDDYYYANVNESQYLNVVMEYFEQTLHSLNNKAMENSTHIHPILIKIYTYQLLRALQYLSTMSIAHRDIKPCNILVNPHTNRVVICDFGSAKQLVKNQSNIAYICSRCYRAPQLIFGATDYDQQIDMWSLGCVIVQLINGEQLFMGESQNQQLIEIIKVLGTPSKQTVCEMNKKYNIKEYDLPQIKPKQWKKILRIKADPLLVDLISKIMQYSPARRLRASQALCHPYFEDFRIESRYKQMTKQTAVPDLSDFNRDQIGSYKKSSDKLSTWHKKQLK